MLLLSHKKQQTFCAFDIAVGSWLIADSDFLVLKEAWSFFKILI